jgi:hypothetical protein
MTIEEMDEHIAYLDAHLKKVRAEAIAETTEELAATKNPYEREWLIEHLEGLRAIGNGQYD